MVRACIPTTTFRELLMDYASSCVLKARAAIIPKRAAFLLLVEICGPFSKCYSHQNMNATQELQSILHSLFDGHGFLVREHIRDYTSLQEEALMSTVKGPLIRLIMPVAHMLPHRDFCGYLEPHGHLISPAGIESGSSAQVSGMWLQCPSVG